MFDFSNCEFYTYDLKYKTLKDGEKKGEEIFYKSYFVVENKKDYLTVPNYRKFVSVPFFYIEDFNTKEAEEVKKRMVVDHSSLGDVNDHLKIEFSIEQEPEADNEKLFKDLVDYLCDYFDIEDKRVIPNHVKLVTLK